MLLTPTSNTDSFTLHLRITKKCNADCAYCSSFEPNAKDLMHLEHVKQSIGFIKKMIADYQLGGTRQSLTVQYIGGELLTVPLLYLQNFCEIVETTLSPLFKHFRQGAQTNLLGSQQRITDLLELFNGNIGTSLDMYTQQRTLGKSAEKYKTYFLKNLDYTKKLTGKNLSSIVVIDQLMAPHIKNQVNFAEEKKMHITLRPVFSGGMPINSLTTTSLNSIYGELFSDWFMKSSIAIEPFFSLLEKRLLKHTQQKKSLATISGCPFQHNCAYSSLNMEPDGTLFICLDMADSKHYPIGNALTENVNHETLSLLMSRSKKLNEDCLSCSYFDECQGGCMNEAIEQTGDVFGKTQYCVIWKTIFKKIDDGINEFSPEKVEAWLNKIKKTF